VVASGHPSASGPNLAQVGESLKPENQRPQPKPLVPKPAPLFRHLKCPMTTATTPELSSRIRWQFVAKARQARSLAPATPPAASCPHRGCTEAPRACSRSWGENHSTEPTFSL